MHSCHTTIILFFLTLIFSIISIFIGVIEINLWDINYLEIIFISRLPRLSAILCTGMGMSVAGLIMQQLCMNKFMSPSTGATVASAQFGILLTLLIFSNSSLWVKTLIAFISAMSGTWIFVWFIQKIQFKDAIMVPLVGIMFGNVISAIVNYFSYRYDLMQVLNGALIGDFSLILRGNYEIVFMVLPLIVISYAYANHFNIVGMGQNFSNNLGIPYNTIIFIGLSISSLITASIIVTVGTVPYIGLIVPNIISLFRGDQIKGSLLDVMLFGALFILICDIVGRLVIFPYELPINLISGIVGSIIFVILMFKRINT